jgi:hypothetical protein
MISRRDLIRNLVISVGGSSLLSACGGRVTLDPLSPGAPPRFYTEREMALVSRVADLVIPRTETPGALDVQVPELLDQLMAEWADGGTRSQHRAGLAALDAELSRRAGGDFLDASPSAAESALAAVDEAAFDGEPVAGYRDLKSLITQTYFSTEGGAVEELEWVAVPGRWDPCMDRGGRRG